MSRDAFLYRSYIALGKTSIPLKEINPKTASTALKAVRRFAEYIASAEKRYAYSFFFSQKTRILQI